MDADLLLSILVGACAFIMLFFRTNVSLAIMGLCVGYVLSDIVTSSVVDFVYSSNLDESTLPITSGIAIVLTLLPAMLIIFRFKHYQKGRYLQHLFPSAAFALLAVLLVLLNLPLDMQRELSTDSVVYNRFISNQVLIVLAAASIAIFDVLVHDREQKRKHKKKSKKKD